MEINKAILKYIEQNIIPQYALFDKAHNFEHVDKVIKNSLAIYKDYNVDINQVYVIAAYHDIGLSQGREYHEKASALYLLSDNNLRQWFTEEEMRLMSEAIEDHRASNDYEPRSIYGKIVSEADRDIEYKTILQRTIQYSLKNYPHYNMEEHYNRTYEHIKEKYGVGGYLKLWLKTEKNQINLQELQNMIMEEDKFKKDFQDIYKSCRGHL